MRRALCLAPLALVFAGCGGGGSNSSSAGSQPAASAGETVTISEAEYKLTPSSLSVAKPGTVQIKITNNGQIGHALEIEGSGVESKTNTIDPGNSDTLTVTLSHTGSYEVYCPIDSHRDRGMKATLVVGAGSPASGGTSSSPSVPPGTTTAPTTTDKSGGGYGY